MRSRADIVLRCTPHCPASCNRTRRERGRAGGQEGGTMDSGEGRRYGGSVEVNILRRLKMWRERHAGGQGITGHLNQSYMLIQPLETTRGGSCMCSHTTVWMSSAGGTALRSWLCSQDTGLAMTCAPCDGSHLFPFFLLPLGRVSPTHSLTGCLRQQLQQLLL